jgi:hypothetical protein
MPPLPVIADTVRVAFEWNATGGGTATNVLHFGTALTSESDIFDVIQSHFTANMWGAISASAHINIVSVQFLDGTSARHDFVSTGSNTGLGNAEYIPQVACIVKLTTALRGREHRGRIFLPFISENNFSTGGVDAAAVAAMHTAWGNFVTACDADDVGLGVASYKLATFTPITDLVVELRSGTQRRRNSRLR